MDGSAEKLNFNLASVGKGRGVRERRQVAGKDLAPIGDRGEEERAQTERGGEGHQRPGQSQSQRLRRWSQAPGTGGKATKKSDPLPLPHLLGLHLLPPSVPRPTEWEDKEQRHGQ